MKSFVSDVAFFGFFKGQYRQSIQHGEAGYLAAFETELPYAQVLSLGSVGPSGPETRDLKRWDRYGQRIHHIKLHRVDPPIRDLY